MPHETEKSFQYRVRKYLEKKYGKENVLDHEYLKESPFEGETGRFVDYWVNSPIGILAIEVENDFEACFKGTGQAIVYALHEREAMPLIIVPPGHVKEPEATMLSTHTPIIELDV